MRRLQKQGVHNASTLSFGDGGDNGIGGKATPASATARVPRSNNSVRSSIDNPLTGNYSAQPSSSRRKAQNFGHNAAGSSITF